jgi:predicted metal-binding protein
MSTSKEKQAGTRLTIEDFRVIAIAREGKCLSKTYVSNAERLKWKCKKDHIWLATGSHVKNDGNWCPKCCFKTNYSIENMQEIALAHGGECLSTKFVNLHTKLKWKCKEGHEWEAKPDKMVYRNGWCAKCFYKRNSANQTISKPSIGQAIL